jgi:hypothetical protein
MQSPRPKLASTISLPSCEGMLMGMVPLTTVTISSPGEPIRKLDAPIERCLSKIAHFVGRVQHDRRPPIGAAAERGSKRPRAARSPDKNFLVIMNDGVIYKNALAP